MREQPQGDGVVTSKEYYHLTSNDKWKLYIIIGPRDTWRSYDITLRRSRFHLKLGNFDIPAINQNFILHEHQTMPKIIKHTGKTTYQSLFPEKLVPLKSSFKLERTTIFQGYQVTCAQSCKMTKKPFMDVINPDLLIPIELLCLRTSNTEQDVAGGRKDLSQSKPCGHSQAQEGSNSNSQIIVHFRIPTL